MPECMSLHPVQVMSTERGAAERGPPARKVSLGALKVSSSFLPFPWGLFALSLLLLLSLWKQLLLYPSSLAPFPQRFALMKIWRREREDPSLEETSNLDNILPNFSGTENVKCCEAKVKQLGVIHTLTIRFSIL